MNFFKKLFKVNFTEDELLQKFLDIMYMNDIDLSKFVIKDSIWGNPHHQFYFTSSHFTKQDFVDFKNGTGDCIKGKNDLEKKLYLDLYHWTKKHSTELFVYEFKHFPLVTYSKVVRNGYGSVEDVNPANTFDNYSKIHQIQNAFGAHLASLVSEFGYRERRDIYIEWNATSWGIKKTLIDMDIGFFGASNIPRQIENLSWYSDLVPLVANYIHLKNEGLTKPFDDFINHFKDDEKI